MAGEAIIHQPKQERQRTRWTAALDKIFADLVVEQIQLGNRPNNVFDKKTWNHIRDEFNKQTDLNFNNNQLRKHLDVLRTRYLSTKSAFDQNEFVIDEPCGMDFEMWAGDIEAQPRTETPKIKECPIFDQLSTIFAESGADGKYAQSSHYEELNKSLFSELEKSLLGADDFLKDPHQNGEDPSAITPSSSGFATTSTLSAQCSSRRIQERKRKRSSETGHVPVKAVTDQEKNEIMAKAMLDMLHASKVRGVLKPKVKEKFTITNCVKMLDEIESEEGMDSRLYFAALDLFEDPNLREMFVSLKSDKIRLAWLQGKCGNANSSIG